MEILSVFKHALMITVFVFVMMLLVDFIDMASKGRMSGMIKGGPWRQYTLASFLGATPYLDRGKDKPVYKLQIT
jgi:hypothetical protein